MYHLDICLRNVAAKQVINKEAALRWYTIVSSTLLNQGITIFMTLILTVIHI
jgi:hypothetical protein